MTFNKFLRWTAIASVFAVFLTPFIVANGQFFPFITGKAFYFRTVVEIGFAAWLLLTLRDASARPRRSVLLWSLVVFLAVIGVADIFGVNAWKSFWSNFERMEGYVTIIHLFLYFLVASSVLSAEKSWKRFLEWSVGANAFICMYGLMQLSGHMIINQGGVRVDATLGNATYLAIFLVFNIFFALALIVKDRRERLSPYLAGAYGIAALVFWLLLANAQVLGSSAFAGWVVPVIILAALAALFLSYKYSKAYFYGFLAIVSTLILYYTATRGAILGLLGGLLLAALLVALFDRGEKRFRIAAASVVGLVVVVVLGFLAVKNTSFVQHSPVLSRFASISWNDTKTQARGYIWPMAIKGFKEHPILGWGQENFSYIFNANYDPRMYSQEQWFDRAHNVVLDWLTAGGILGLLAYLSLFASALYLLWRRATDTTFTEKALFTGLLAAYFFHNLFVFDNLVSYYLFFALLAMIHFKSTRLSHPIAENADEVEGSELLMSGPLILICLVFSLYFFVWRGYETSSSLIDALRASNSTPVQGEAALTGFKKALSYDTLGRQEVTERIIESVGRMNSPEVPLAVRQEFFEVSKDAVENLLKNFPNDTRYEAFAASYYSIYNDPTTALAHFNRALELSPNKQSLLVQLGNFHITYKNYPEAVKAYKQAYDLDQTNATAAKYYAVALLYNKQTADARAFLKQRFGSDAMTDDLFLQAFADQGDWNSVISGLKTRIAANPTNMNDRKNLAAAYARAGNKAAAVATVREMITLDPSFKEQGEAYIQQIQAGQ